MVQPFWFGMPSPDTGSLRSPDERSDIRCGAGVVPDIAALIRATKLMPSIRPINAIASAAKQSILSRDKMDCFAALAMRLEYDFVFSRHDLPEVLHDGVASTVKEIMGRR
jgi:hypothetical protein